MTEPKRGNIFTYFLSLIILVVMIVVSSGSYSFGIEDGNPNLGFSEYYYYDADNQKRYKDFKRNNPIIRNADVVWMVNMDLDNEKYKNANITENPGEMLVLVNKHNMLPISYVPAELKTVGNGQKMIPEAADSMIKLLDDAKDAGMEIIPQSGYRSYKLQSTIYEENKGNDPDEVDTYSARPGYSEHQTGLAMDINVPYGGSLRDFVGTDEAKWVAKNAHKYGFIVRYTEDNRNITGYMAEPWHVRYVGKEHAKKIKSEKIKSFEEYTAKYLRQENNS